MRIITGDECGLLKEFVPSLIKKKTDKDKDFIKLPPNNKFNKNAVVPIVGEISSADNNKNDNNCIKLLQDNKNVPLIDSMNRRYGIIDITWIESSIQFATLSINGTIKIWTKNTKDDETNQSYTKTMQIDYIFDDIQDEDDIHDDDDEGDDDDDDDDDIARNISNNKRRRGQQEQQHQQLDNDSSASGKKKKKTKVDGNDAEGDNDNDTNIENDELEANGTDDDDDEGDEEDESSTSTSSTAIEPPLNPLTFGIKIEYWKEGQKLIACNAQGMVVTVDISMTATTSTGSNEEQEEAASETAMKTDPDIQVQTLLYIYGEDAANVYGQEQHHSGQKHTTQVVSAFAYNPYTQYIAAGGRDRETVVYDLNNLYPIKSTASTTTSAVSNDTSSATANPIVPQPIWKAKNLPPNPQTLLSPLVWPTAITFLKPYDKNNTKQDRSETTNEDVNDDDNIVLMAVGTAHKQIRIYEICNEQRRPIQFTPEGAPCQYRITSVQQNPQKLNQLIISDAGGYIYSIDNIEQSLLRGKVAASRMQTIAIGGGNKANKNYKPVTLSTSCRRYVGPAGSVRQMLFHPTKSLMACVGLDRMLRIYNTKQQKQIHCVYLKQRLNCLLLVNDSTDTNNDCGDNNGLDTMDITKHNKQNDDDDNNSDNDDSNNDDDIVEDYTDSNDDDDSENDSVE